MDPCSRRFGRGQCPRAPKKWSAFFSAPSPKERHDGCKSRRSGLWFLDFSGGGGKVVVCSVHPHAMHHDGKLPGKRHFRFLQAPASRQTYGP